MPASASIAPVRGFMHRHAGVVAAHRRDGGPLERRADRRAHRRRLDGAGAASGAAAGQQRAAWRPGQPGLEDPLQAVEPDLGAGGIARARHSAAASAAGIGPTVPTICPATSGIGEVRAGPCGERRAVAGQQRPARREA